MESNLVTGEDQTGERRKKPPLSYGQQFQELCGWYLSIGMTYSDYWDGDPEMAVHYREKNKRDTERKNTELWLQGEYIYEAILYASPVYNVFAKHPKPIPYRDEPIPLTPHEREDKEERDNRKKMEAGKDIMMGLMESINARFKKKEQENGSQTGESGV